MTLTPGTPVRRIEGDTDEPGVIVWATSTTAQVRWAGGYQSRLSVAGITTSGRTDGAGEGTPLSSPALLDAPSHLASNTSEGQRDHAL